MWVREYKWLCYFVSRINWVNKTSKKKYLNLYLIRWTTPISQKRITYQTVQIGTTKLKQGGHVEFVPLHNLILYQACCVCRLVAFLQWNAYHNGVMCGQHSANVGEGSRQGCCHGVIFYCVMCHGSFGQVTSCHLRGLGSVLGHWWTSGIAAGCCLCTSVVLCQYYHTFAPDSFIHRSTMVYVFVTVDIIVKKHAERKADMK